MQKITLIELINQLTELKELRGVPDFAEVVVSVDRKYRKIDPHKIAYSTSMVTLFEAENTDPK